MNSSMRASQRSSVTVHRTPVSIMLICAAALIFEGYDIYVFGVVVPDLLAHPGWQISPAFVGLIGSAAVFGMLIGALLAGFLTDLVGRRKIFIGAVTMFSVGMVLCAIAPTPELLLLSRIIVGIGGGGFMPTVLATIVEYSPAGKKNFNVSLALAGIGAGGVTAALLGIWAMPTFGYTFMFWFGIIPMALLPVILRKLPESVSYLVTRSRLLEAEAVIRDYKLPMEITTVHGSHTADEVTEAPARRGAVALSLFSREHLGATMVFWFGTAFCMVLNFGANAWLPAIMINQGYGLQSSLTFLVALNVGAVAGSLLGSKLADRTSPKRVVLIGFLTSAVSLCILAFQPPTIAVYLLVVLVGFGAAGTQNLINSYMATYYPAYNRGSGVGFALAFGRLGGIFGPIYGGLIVASGGDARASFFAFAIPAVLALVVMSFGPKMSSASAVPTPAPLDLVEQPKV